MKKIPLTRGKFALVDDDDDYERLSKHKWYFTGIYARRIVLPKTVIWMHREIMSCPKEFMIDHINHNKIDNRKQNLRICTNQQNQWNQKKTKRKTSSKYKGVWFNKKTNRWVSAIRINGKQKIVGIFKTEKQAARKYNEMALKHYKSFAGLNKV